MRKPIVWEEPRHRALAGASGDDDDGGDVAEDDDDDDDDAMETTEGYGRGAISTWSFIKRASIFF
jgi:hypothetical protein